MVLQNKLCWCGSKEPYQQCHKEFDKKLKTIKYNGHALPKKKMIKNKYQIEGIRQAALINNGLLDYIEEHICAGMTTEHIDILTQEYLSKHQATSADLGYYGYPKSICTSVNDEVCHGIPDANRILQDGDIINVDATTCYNHYYADASRMFLIGNVSDEAKKLVKVTKECLQLAIDSIVPYETSVGDIGKIIEKHAHLHGYSVVEEFCGHGVGLSMHEDPYVFHYDAKIKTVTLVPGMVITIEPMINQGTKEIYVGENEWTAYTQDGLLSAQWEHTILITETGAEILSY